MRHFNIRFTERKHATLMELVVEFYDAAYPRTELGQFVSRYFIGTLLADRKRLCQYGLILNGGVPEWSVSPNQMLEIFETIDTYLRVTKPQRRHNNDNTHPHPTD